MIDQFQYNDEWRDVKRSAWTTVGKDSDMYPKNKWKKTILLAEHSPIRRIRCFWRWSNLKSWVSTHFVRHKFGIEHWVSTQRTDRTGKPRDELPQDAPVMHACEANAQALINISRKRLCNQAAPETRKAWQEVRAKIAEADPVLASVMVPECVYRGFCPEFHSCGYANTKDYAMQLHAYRQKEIEESI